MANHVLQNPSLNSISHGSMATLLQALMGNQMKLGATPQDDATGCLGLFV